MNYHHGICRPDGLEHLKKLDKICPKCRTAQYTLLSSSEIFHTQFLMEDFRFKPEEDYITVKQETYVCSQCNTFWKGLAYSGKIESAFTKHVVFSQTARIRLDVFQQMQEYLVGFLVLIGILGFIAFMCSLQ